MFKIHSEGCIASLMDAAAGFLLPPKGFLLRTVCPDFFVRSQNRTPLRFMVTHYIKNPNEGENYGKSCRVSEKQSDAC